MFLKKPLVFFLLFLFSASSFAQDSSSKPALSELEQKAVIGRDLILHRRYIEAIDHFKKVSQENPNSPLGSFGQMAAWQVHMFENYDFRFDKEYEEVSKENERISDAVLKNNEASPFELFIVGAAAGMRGFYLMRKDQVWKGLTQANIARKALARARGIDPTYIDVNLGLGMYDYWRSVYTTRFSFLPFFDDKRAQGLAMVSEVAKSGRVAGPLAEISLVFCYYEARDFAKTTGALQEMLKKYPENVILKNILGDMYSQQGNFSAAHQIFEKIKKENPDVIVAQFFDAKTYFREGKLPEARKDYDAFLATHPAPAWTAYALTDLGFIDLKEGKEDAAYENFKKAYRTYSDYPYPLYQLRKMRKRW